MGKYMRKARVTGGEVAVVEVTADDQASLSSDYLQLRSRRLEKTYLAPSKEASKGASFAPRKPRCPPSNKDDSLPSQRGTRETTPCSSLCNSVATQTSRSPGKTASVRRSKDAGCEGIPCPKELEEFFQEAEQLQLKLFMEKYNFDPVNDCPLVGRYEWVKLDSS